MEAAANEYEAPASVPVDLAATTADIAAMEAEPVSEAPVEVAIVPPTELATATPVVGTEVATVTLDGAEPGLAAEGLPSGGAAPVAALYWLCRRLDGGADAMYLSRRIVRMAWEDIGLADPRAMQLANDAASTYERLGSPEGELALAQAVIYLAVAPKSNAGYMAFNQAMAFVRKDKSREVPVHLRNAPTKLMKELGHGKAYRYAHDEPEGYAAGENYLPDGMPEPGWYKPVARGLELKIAEKLRRLRDLDEQG